MIIINVGKYKKNTKNKHLMTAVVITAMLSPGKTHGSVSTDFGALKT